MSKKSTKTLRTKYKRGKVEISGDSPDARHLMYIDMIAAKLFWIAGFIAFIYLGSKSNAFSTLFDFVAALIRGDGKTSS